MRSMSEAVQNSPSSQPALYEISELIVIPDGEPFYNENAAPAFSELSLNRIKCTTMSA